MRMKTADFDFSLPPALIALRPAEPRDSARLLHVAASGLADHHIHDLPQILRKGDLLIGNNTKVIPAQLSGKRGNAKIDVTLLKSKGGGLWQAFAKPAKKLRLADVVEFSPGFEAFVENKEEDGEIHLRFHLEETEFLNLLQEAGSMPLPPYIRKRRTPDKKDNEDYQTIFAQSEGAVAAPTAGLHFTDRLFQELEKSGIESTFVTLHVGAGTFLPVKADDPKLHKMHEEIGVISSETAAKINQAKREGRRIVAIGTTVLRLLESAVTPDGEIRSFKGATDIFLLPGHQFRTADLLMTNFHLPKSTLFMLVSAFAGTQRMRQAYEYAIAHNYRFYSYGDASLLERA